MNQRNNKPSQAYGNNPVSGAQAAKPQLHKPLVMQPKMAVPSQMKQQPGASPVYRPQSKPQIIQQKTVGSSQMGTPPLAPPVYRPQPVPKVLQKKSASVTQSAEVKSPRQPVAPPAYRPQVTPKVLQTKKTVSQLAPPVAGAGRPAGSSVQTKSASNIPTHKPVQKGQPLPKHALSQTVQRRAAPARNPLGSGRSAGQRNVSGVVQRYPTLDDSGRKDAMIYCISTNDLTEIIYVGQTTDARAGDRFLEHVKNDGWAPWWVHKPNVYGDDESKWPYRVRTLEALKNVTKFETTAAEQWWLEKYLKEGKKLLNDATACSLDCFLKRSVDSDLYDPKNIGVAASWKPSMKAK